jgi:predicted HTH domain antitoxin
LTAPVLRVQASPIGGCAAGSWKTEAEGPMQIELDDEVAAKAGVDQRQALELLAVALYKFRGIHGAMAGRMLGLSELEFHQLLGKLGTTVNYDLNDLVDDIKNNDL